MLDLTCDCLASHKDQAGKAQQSASEIEVAFKAAKDQLAEKELENKKLREQAAAHEQAANKHKLDKKKAELALQSLQKRTVAPAAASATASRGLPAGPASPTRQPIKPPSLDVSAWLTC